MFQQQQHLKSSLYTDSVKYQGNVKYNANQQHLPKSPIPSKKAFEHLTDLTNSYNPMQKHQNNMNQHQQLTPQPKTNEKLLKSLGQKLLFGENINNSPDYMQNLRNSFNPQQSKQNQQVYPKHLQQYQYKTNPSRNSLDVSKAQVTTPQNKSLSANTSSQNQKNIQTLAQSTSTEQLSKKCNSITNNGLIKAYAATTNQGVIRNYNEDRVSIILNIAKPKTKNDPWPNCSYFGVYDGHGGYKCADFLKENLHAFVINQSCFPANPIDAIRLGFAQAEKYYLDQAIKQNPVEKSGSCAIVALFVDQLCYIANVGDSRAVLSENLGQTITDLSRDHKPCDELEKKRIKEAGGSIYQAQIPSPTGTISAGPLRVFPGRLSVSRTFGDIEAKYPQYGGNPRVVIAEPEITVLKINEKHDFIILACDGIFDQLKSQESINCIWNSYKKCNDLNLHQMISQGAEELLQFAIEKESTDNVTVLQIQLKDTKAKNENLILIDNQNKIEKVTETKKQLTEQKENNTITKLNAKQFSHQIQRKDNSNNQMYHSLQNKRIM